MTEHSFEQKPPKVPLPAEEYHHIGAELFKIIRAVESGAYAFSPKTELLLLQFKQIFEELSEERRGRARVAEFDLNKNDPEPVDPGDAVKEARLQFEKSYRTEEDEAKMWGNIFFARPELAAEKAGETYDLVQTRGLNRPSAKISKFGKEELKYPGRDYPEIDEQGTPANGSLEERIGIGKKNQSNN